MKSILRGNSILYQFWSSWNNKRLLFISERCLQLLWSSFDISSADQIFGFIDFWRIKFTRPFYQWVRFMREQGFYLCIMKAQSLFFNGHLHVTVNHLIYKGKYNYCIQNCLNIFSYYSVTSFFVLFLQLHLLKSHLEI